ncbi:hypothetical protein JTB14_000659 [Gonioctena quinquepunctata]|nr:hypothetical protein JTB14_000659 [Gonioctena quinquepunctata]
MESYADDTQIKYSFDIENIPVAVQRLNSDLEHLSNYCGKHALKLDHKKSLAMLFCAINVYEMIGSEIILHIDNVLIPLVTEAKNLGLILDIDFKFMSQ